MDKERLQKYFYYLLSRKDYSEFELRQKAKIKGYLEVDIDEIINQFIKYKYVDDRRFCEEFIRYKSEYKGRNWLLNKLKQKGLNIELINNCLENLPPDPSENLKKMIESKYKIHSWQDIDFKIKNKVYQFLAYRGYTNPIEIVTNWSNDDLC